MFVPTRHAHGSHSDQISFRSIIASKFSADKHNDWDHELYFWGCEDVMQLTDDHHSVTEAGETPGDMEDRMRRRIQELPRDGYTFYNLTKGNQVGQSASLLNEMLSKNKSARLMMSLGKASELTNALRYREIMPPSRSKDKFAFQPAQFGGPGLQMPNADLILTISQDWLENMPEPTAENERAFAITAMKNHWISERQNASQWSEEDDARIHKFSHLHTMGRGATRHLSTRTMPRGILRMLNFLLDCTSSLCRKRMQLHTSVDSLV